MTGFNSRPKPTYTPPVASVNCCSPNLQTAEYVRASVDIIGATTVGTGGPPTFRLGRPTWIDPPTSWP